MLKHFTMAYKFMRGYSFRVRFVFACYFMFQEKYRAMPLTPSIDAVIIGDSSIIAALEQEEC